MSTTESWTIGRLLTWTADFLKQHGSDSPRLDAELLLAHAKGCPRIELYTAFTDVADEATRTAFRALVKRRGEGTPVAYLLGRREFYSLSFQVTSDVLIPRPETEFLLIALLDRAKATGATDARLAIADVGTGSGILAVCAAKYLKQSQVTAIDISPAALRVALANAQEHGVVDRIEFVTGDLLAGLPADRQFDFIVSNPPYVSEAEFAELAPDVRDYEPRGALVAGPKGTEIIERLVAQAAERLRPGGWLLVEISPMIAEAVQATVRNSAALELAPIVRDLAGLARIVAARRHG
jgi:release factor glutamine methyltransferase